MISDSDNKGELQTTNTHWLWLKSVKQVVVHTESVSEAWNGIDRERAQKGQIVGDADERVKVSGEGEGKVMQRDCVVMRHDDNAMRLVKMQVTTSKNKASKLNDGIRAVLMQKSVCLLIELSKRHVLLREVFIRIGQRHDEGRAATERERRQEREK